MQLKYVGSKSWLAPHVDRLLGRRSASLSLLRFWKAGVLPRNPTSGPEGARRRRLRPANLHRCYLRQDPVFLRSLLRLAGRKVDRRFYFSHLLPGTQRGRAGRRAACSYVLLRNSFSGKWGSFTQQRPLALSSVRRLQRPPRNVTGDVRTHWAIYALCPPGTRQAIYADPPYIFPGRSMNYYGTKRRGHDLAFHLEL